MEPAVTATQGGARGNNDGDDDDDDRAAAQLLKDLEGGPTDIVDLGRGNEDEEEEDGEDGGAAIVAPPVRKPRGRRLKTMGNICAHGKLSTILDYAKPTIDKNKPLVYARINLENHYDMYIGETENIHRRILLCGRAHARARAISHARVTLCTSARHCGVRASHAQQHSDVLHCVFVLFYYTECISRTRHSMHMRVSLVRVHARTATQ